MIKLNIWAKRWVATLDEIGHEVEDHGITNRYSALYYLHYYISYHFDSIRFFLNYYKLRMQTVENSRLEAQANGLISHSPSEGPIQTENSQKVTIEIYLSPFLKFP